MNGTLFLKKVLTLGVRYDIIVIVKGREIAEQLSCLWILGNETNFSKKFEKPLDKSPKM
jgi:hypothetical protein